MKRSTSPPTPPRSFVKARTGAAGVGGFSLIEVVLAIGVVAFSFVALLGLLPAGLSNFRKAMDASIGAEIGQRVMNDLQQSDFDTLLTQTSNSGLPKALTGVLSQQGFTAVPTPVVAGTGYLSHRFFDDQGNEVVVTQSTTYNPTDPTPAQRTAGHILYDVHVQIVLKSQIPSKIGSSAGVSSSSAQDGFVESPSLANVVIQVFSNPAGAALADPVTATRTSGSQSVYVAGSTSVPFTTYTGFIARTSRNPGAPSSGS